MKSEYVGIFMPKMKGWNYEKENNMYDTCCNDGNDNNSLGRTLVAQ